MKNAEETHKLTGMPVDTVAQIALAAAELRKMGSEPRTDAWVRAVDDWRKPWPGFSGTRYESKAKRAGRASCYLIFRRN